MKSIETSGKTVEDAVKTGLKELMCESSDVTIDVLDMGSPGLFGMFGRLAKVRLTLKEQDTDFDLEMPVMSLKEQKPRPEKKKPLEKPRQEKRVEVEKPRQEKKPPVVEAKAEKAPEAPSMQSAEPVLAQEVEAAPPRPARPPRQRTPRPPRPAPMAITEELPPLEYDALSEKAQKAYDFLVNVTKLMGVDIEIRMAEGEEQLSVQMIGDTLGILIGRRGETLDALQYLTSLQVNKGRDDYTRVTLDTEHYRAKREEALNKLANRMASRVRKTGHRVALEPMNPYERRILHSALQSHPYVSTHSEGDEPYRRVIITLK